MKRRRASTSGSILLTVLATMVVLAGLVAAAITITGEFTRHAARSRAMSQALAIGDGSLQMLYADWQAQSRSYALANPGAPLPAFTPATNCRPTAAEFPGLQTYAAGANKLMVDPATFGIAPIMLTGTATKAAGTSASVASYYYKASVDVTAPALTKPVTTHLRRHPAQRSPGDRGSSCRATPVIAARRLDHCARDFAQVLFQRRLHDAHRRIVTDESPVHQRSLAASLAGWPLKMTVKGAADRLAGERLVERVGYRIALLLA